MEKNFLVCGWIDICILIFGFGSPNRICNKPGSTDTENKKKVKVTDHSHVEPFYLFFFFLSFNIVNYRHSFVPLFFFMAGTEHSGTVVHAYDFYIVHNVLPHMLTYV